jgi:hypothetical protein
MNVGAVCSARAASMLLLASCLIVAAGPADAAELEPIKGAAGPCPSIAELEAQGYRIGAIDVNVLPIFDDDPEGKHQSLYELADRLHIDTRDSVIESQLLFKSGDPVSQRLIEETERNLRDRRYMREPAVRAVSCHDGTADLEVAVRDVWTTNPGISFGRSGGANSGGITLEELNLLGLGKQLSFGYSKDPDRSSYTLHWHDPNVGGSRWVNDVAYRDASDGQGWSFMLRRPFYQLDSRWSTGLTLQQDESVEPVYRLGEQIAGYGRKVEFGEFSFGRSSGLRDDWTRRFIFGFRREHAEFDIAPDETAPLVIPEDRLLDYPFARIEGVQDDFETTQNRDQIARTEDLHFGIQYALELGYSTPALGADRNAALVHAEASRGWRLGENNSMFADASLTGRVESGAAADTLLSTGWRYYHSTGPNSLFFTGVTAASGWDLDADHELTLGGDNGLRGYPLRFQTGSSLALLTIEERYYTKYSLWKLADVGGAIFFDMGRTWGDSAFGPTENIGLLKDVGFGLRLGSTRSALGNVLHIDIAFPLDGPSSIDRVQLLIRTKSSF